MEQLAESTRRGYRYVVGIDLGTTNSVVAYVDLERRGPSGRREVQIFEIPQLVGAGELGHLPVLPSFLYLPGPYDLPEDATALPWDPKRSYVVGTFAREQGVRVPGRLVASAKSWLSHSSVDRTAPILPWGAPDDVARVSPVEAARRYLQHIREAWNEQRSDEGEGSRLENQLLILTVPASFDEVARELTVSAATRAGLPNVILLEEPLAAFYAWLADHDTQRDQIEDGALVLVCDIGGGTTDFSIVGVRRTEDDVQFDRLAVGEHLMLGGDNMDNALGRKVETELAGGPGKLDVQRWYQLVHACRQAKEQLLGTADDDADVEVTVLGASSKLIGGTLAATLTAREVRQMVLDGFFPLTPMDEPVHEGRRSGLTELGLPYTHDPAVTRHLAAFWRRSERYVREETGRDSPFPDYVLFNGGVFKPDTLRHRLTDIVARWFQPVAGTGWTPMELANPDLDLAVAQGAAYYGLARLGEGKRVGSGSPRAYYVGVESDVGVDGEIQPAVCLIPRGAEEGFVGHLDHVEFEARTNQPVTFHLFSSTSRTGDELGEVVRLRREEIKALPPIRTVLQFGRRGVVRRLPVELAVRLTEIGTLELWCQSRMTEHRWQLQFDLRQQEPTKEVATQTSEVHIDHEQLAEAEEAIRRTFEATEEPLETMKQRLEAILDMPRTSWPIPILRKLTDVLLVVPRDHSDEHEAHWFEWLGYCLRPGYGDPVDEWRMQQAWKLHLEGLHFPNSVENRIAWWTFWRRVGGGLPAEKQAQIYYEVRPYMQLEVRTKKKHRIYPRRMELSEKLEAWKALASLERLSTDIKVTLGRLLMQIIKTVKTKDVELWALSRVGTRQPVYGPLDCLVPREEVTSWLSTLLSLPPPQNEHAAYCLAHLARYTGNRDRDVPDEIRDRVAAWLETMPDSDRYLKLMRTPDEDVSHEAMRWFLGEPMPEAAPALEDPHGITFTITNA